MPGTPHQLFCLDLAGAYPATAGVNHWIRKLDYRPGENLTLTESYDLKQCKEPFVLHFIACKPVKTDDKGIIILSSLTAGATIKMEYNPALLEASVEEKPTDDDFNIAKAWGLKYTGLS